MRVRSSIGCLLLLLISPLTAHAQSGQQVFEERCAMCHGIGGEPAAGPDLKDITRRRDREWLLRFIRDPQDAAKTDRVAAALVKEFDDAMPPTEGATRAQLEAVLDYIAAQSVGPPLAGGAAETTARPIDPSALARGRDLYAGRRTLGNGGPACISCHRLGDPAGGTLGPDLTGVHQRLGGSRGLAKWMAAPPTKVMRAVYRSAPLSADETDALVALLGEASAQTPAPPRVMTVAAGGVAGAGIALLTFALTWSRRFRAVRRPMLARAGGDQR